MYHLYNGVYQSQKTIRWNGRSLILPSPWGLSICQSPVRPHGHGHSAYQLNTALRRVRKSLLPCSLQRTDFFHLKTND